MLELVAADNQLLKSAEVSKSSGKHPLQSPHYTSQAQARSSASARVKSVSEHKQHFSQRQLRATAGLACSWLFARLRLLIGDKTEPVVTPGESRLLGSCTAGMAEECGAASGSTASAMKQHYVHKLASNSQARSCIRVGELEDFSDSWTQLRTESPWLLTSVSWLPATFTSSNLAGPSNHSRPKKEPAREDGKQQATQPQ